MSRTTRFGVYCFLAGMNTAVAFAGYVVAAHKAALLGLAMAAWMLVLALREEAAGDESETGRKYAATSLWKIPIWPRRMIAILWCVEEPAVPAPVSEEGNDGE